LPLAPGCFLCFECLFERCSHGTWSSQALSVQRRSGRREVRPGPGRCATLRLSLSCAALGGSRPGPPRLPGRTVLDQEHVLWPHVTGVSGSLCPPPAPARPRCSSGRSVHKQCNVGARCLRVRTSIYGLTLRRAIYCLIYLWRFPPACAPAFFRPRIGGRGCVRGPQVLILPASVGRWTCTVANLRGEGGSVPCGSLPLGERGGGWF